MTDLWLCGGVEVVHHADRSSPMRRLALRFFGWVDDWSWASGPSRFFGWVDGWSWASGPSPSLRLLALDGRLVLGDFGLS